MTSSGGRAEEGRVLRGVVPPTLATLALLLVLHFSRFPRETVQRASDLLQLLLSLCAFGFCARAAAREPALGRAFWSLVALSTLLWSAGQAVWTFEWVALHPNEHISASDLLFLLCSTPLVIAALVRPDRPAASSAGLAFDASLLLVLLLHADAYFAFGELAVGDPVRFQTWQTRLLAARGAVVLIVFLWLIHTGAPPWVRLYRELGLVYALLYGGGAVVNEILAVGRYRPGLMDIGWTVPWLWLALCARAFLPTSAGAWPRLVAVPDWRDTRRGTVLALLAVVLVPVLHVAGMLLGPERPELDRLRGTITVASTLLVGGLFLFRQLHLLGRVERAQGDREASLRSSEERFEKAFRASPVAMSISTFREGRILDANDRFAELTGYPREELLSRTVADLGLWVDATEHEALLRAARDRVAPPETELRYRRKSGEIRAARTSYEIIEVGGETCLLGLSEDVSEKRLLEAQLRQAQKMEAVGRLAGGVAHDFNNLLTAILGYTELMLRRLSGADPVHAHALEIRKAADRAADLVRRLLAFSRKQVRLPQVLDLGQVVRETENMLRRLIGEDVELVTRLTAARGTIRADAGQIEQVIVNLAVNARDAMPRGGILTIGLDEVELDDAFAREHPGARPGPHVRLSVADTGVGMDAEVLSHLFEPFFTTKEVGKGTGLGLATVYGIVKQSDGYIAVRSAPGNGTTFEVHFPHVLGSARDLAEPLADALPRGTETLLLVEDEEAVRKLLGQILFSAGYRVLAAGGGAEALELSRLHPGALDLVITDVVMPGLSGPQLAARLAEERPGTRVLFISGHADGNLGGEAPLGPGRSFLYKPFTAGDLTRRVRQILDGPPGPVTPAS